MSKRHSFSSKKLVLAFIVCQLAIVNINAAEDSDIAQLVRQSGIEGGIVVYLGAGSGQQLLDIRSAGNYVVQGLDRDKKKVQAARKLIQSSGNYGPVSVRLLQEKKLPYMDNLVNVVIADDRMGIPESEIIRVLRPLGIALIRQGRSFKKIVKPWPKTMDEWTHFKHDATGNAVSADDEVGPPRGLQWSAGPRWSRSHEINNSLAAMVTSGGIMFYIFDTGVTGMEDERLGQRWTLFARDAFNGTLLWQRPLTTWGSDKWGNQALRFFGGAMAQRLVAEKGRVYCTFNYDGPVHILDAATGKTLSTVKGSEGAVEIIASGNEMLCVSKLQPQRNKPAIKITCYDAKAGRVKWQAAGKKYLPMTLIAGNNEVFYHDEQNIICLNIDNGSLRWKTPDPKRPGKAGKVLLAVEDKLIATAGNKIIARSVKDGSEIWQADWNRGGSMRPEDIFHIDGRIWTSDGKDFIAAYDINTGDKVEQKDVSAVHSEGHHLRCYRSKATVNFLITQYRGAEFLSLEDQPHNQNDWLRGACTYGVMPANGFLYVPPNSCFCFPSSLMQGLNAFVSPEKEELKNLSENFKPGDLEKGPAYGYIEKQGGRDLSWPMYRYDSRRSGATSETISSSVKRSWKIDLGTGITPPVAANGRLFVAAKDRHTICAFDSLSGKELWTFAAGARIDSPPSIHKGLLVFGSADGYLYCIRASDGKLAWRRRMAPAQQWMAADGQLESVWRLHGSVAIIGDLAYCSAGRSTFLDGGLFLYAVDIKTGRAKYKTNVYTLSDTRTDAESGEFVAAYHMEGGNSDILVAEGGYIFMNQMKFTPELEIMDSAYFSKEEITKRPSLDLDGKDYVNEDIYNVTWRGTTYKDYDTLAGLLVDENLSVGERDMGMHLFTTSGFLDDTYFSRTFWMYSKTWPGFNISNMAPKSGQLVVIGEDNTYSLKAYTSRSPLSPTYTPQTKGYLLIADDNDNDPTMDPRAWGKDKGMGFSRGADPKWHRWIDIRAKAMVLAGDKLIVCGPPDKIKEGDPMASFEGRMPNELMILSAKDGKILARQKIDEMPAFDAMIVANGQLYICTEQGEIICMAPVQY